MGRIVTFGGGILLVLLAILAAAWFLLAASLNDIVKATVEKVGSDVTGTEVTLDKVEISLTAGQGSLFGFRMTNPEGFQSEQAFRFDEVTIKLDVTTVASDPVVIKEVVVLNPEITYEIVAEETNVEVIEENVEAYAGDEDGDGGDEGEGPNIVIENLYLRGGKVKVLASQFTDEEMSVDLPDIHLTDIGRDDRGATPAAIAKEVMGSLLGSMTTAVAAIDISEITDSIGQSLEDAAEAIDTEAIEQGASALGESIGDAAGDAADEAAEALEGLFSDD